MPLLLSPSTVNRRSMSRAWLPLTAILLLAAFLRFYRLGDYGYERVIGNPYYAATVRSMMLSPSNFLFAASEPGGSVTVDKPPVGLWPQVVAAWPFGFNRIALAFPQAAAGCLTVALLYRLIRRDFGVAAGLVAALALSVTPIMVAVERNNTMDGTLVLVLVLAAGEFSRAIQRGHPRHLLAGAVLMGLAFNVKMLQAFLPLPAFFTAYLFGSPRRWPTRLLHLTAAGIVLMTVSLSWAALVELTPPDRRPYVGGSYDNSALGLALDYNGAERFTTGPESAHASLAAIWTAFSRGQEPPYISREVGDPGPLRFFSESLAHNLSWLLPFALIALPLAAGPLHRDFRLSRSIIALVLWGGWLLIGLALLSAIRFMHAHYLVILGPPLAALTGIGIWGLGEQLRDRPRAGLVGLLIGVGITLILQLLILQSYPAFARWLQPLIGLGYVAMLAVALAGWLTTGRFATWGRAALTIGLATMLIAPAVWSLHTALTLPGNTVLMHAGPYPAWAGGRPSLEEWDMREQRAAIVWAYVEPRTQGMRYPLAAVRSFDAAPFITQNASPVLIMGGFSAGDPVVAVEDVAALAAAGQLGFIYLDDAVEAKRDIMTWAHDHCQRVDWRGWFSTDLLLLRRDFEGEVVYEPITPILFDCRMAAMSNK